MFDHVCLYQVPLRTLFKRRYINSDFDWLIDRLITEIIASMDVRTFIAGRQKVTSELSDVSAEMTCCRLL